MNHQPDRQPPDEAPLETAPPPAPERFPFWGYGDLFLFIGMAFVSLWLGVVTVRGVYAAAHFTPRNKILEVLPAQFLGYAILFGFLFLLFRFQYGRPLWSSLRWVPARTVSFGTLLVSGVGLALLVGLLGVALRTPDINSPMKNLLSDRTSVVLLAIFGTTLGPFFEELIFRGFMQPLFVKTMGAVAGILLAAAAFGALHLQEYAWSWRHGLLITFAGAMFGLVRHRTGSTLASTLVHAAYNTTFFLALLAQPGAVPKHW